MQRPDFAVVFFFSREGGVYHASGTLLDSEERVRAPEGHTTAEACFAGLMREVFARVDRQDGRPALTKPEVP